LPLALLLPVAVLLLVGLLTLLGLLALVGLLLLVVLLLLLLLLQPATTMVTAAAETIPVARAGYLLDMLSSWRVEMTHCGCRDC
jgi:hypothetical protein